MNLLEGLIISLCKTIVFGKLQYFNSGECSLQESHGIITGGVIRHDHLKRRIPGSQHGRQEFLEVFSTIPVKDHY